MKFTKSKYVTGVVDIDNIKNTLFGTFSLSRCFIWDEHYLGMEFWREQDNRMQLSECGREELLKILHEAERRPLKEIIKNI